MLNIIFTLILTAAPKTYDVQGSAEIHKILSSVSCLHMIEYGSKAELLAGWKVGKITVTDEDGPFFWNVNAKDYHIKRTLTLYFYGSETEPKRILKTIACGAEPFEKSQAPEIWDP